MLYTHIRVGRGRPRYRLTFDHAAFGLYLTGTKWKRRTRADTGGHGYGRGLGHGHGLGLGLAKLYGKGRHFRE
jgi:hypothetical protein